jgi:OOP family OmpA-OmpF porin
VWAEGKELQEYLKHFEKYSSILMYFEKINLFLLTCILYNKLIMSLITKNKMNYKKYYLFLTILLGGLFVGQAFAQEELEEETPVVTKVSKADAKKLQKEAQNQSTKPIAPAKTTAIKAAPVAQEDGPDKPAVSKGNNTTSAPVKTGGTLGTSSINKSAEPPTFNSLDSVAQGNLNLYKPRIDTNWIDPWHKQQARDFNEGTNPYAPKARNMWEIGLKYGIPTIGGDIQVVIAPFKTQAWGFTVRKSLGYMFSLRMEYVHGVRVNNLGWKGVEVITNNPAITGRYDPKVNYASANRQNPINGTFYHNSYTKYRDISGEMAINFNNIKFHRERNKIALYGIVGGSLMLFNTKIDQLDAAGNIYNYSSINALTGAKERKKALLAILDEKYESQAEQDGTQKFLGKELRAGNVGKWNQLGAFVWGLGISFRLTRKISLSIETKNAHTDNDLVDGQRWQEHAPIDPALTVESDKINFTSVGLNYALGKRSSEPMWWLNPLDNLTNDIRDVRTAVTKVPEFTDTDDDGVIDMLDREPNTPEGCLVDTHGVQLDSDKDGVPDCVDHEPFSIPGARVDQYGVAPKKDSEFIMPNFDSILATLKVPSGTSGSSNFKGWILPMIHFDLDKSFIKPDFYPELYHVAQVMSMYPEMKVYVDGHTDIRMPNAYNDDLSMRRATNARNFIIKNYNVDPERLVIRFRGEGDNLVKDLPDRFDARFEREQYMNRRVEFSVVPDSIK